MEVEIDGNIILFIKGKNAKNNTLIINEASDEDLWYHVTDMPSLHVIAKINDLELTKQQYKNVVMRGAKITKMFSKYSSCKSLMITYTKIKNVQITNVPGLVNLIEYKNILV